MERLVIFLLICCIAVNAQFASDTGDLDLFANNDESLLSEEPSTESSSSFNPDPDNIILNDHSYENFDLASISCLPPSPPLSPSRKFKLRTREAGDACVSSEQTYNPALLSESVRSYWCPVNLRMQLEAMSSGFGSIPVCDTDPIWAGPSELDLEDWGERVLPSSGLINLAECYPLPFTDAFCPKESIYCCNSYLPFISKPGYGFGYWCAKVLPNGPSSILRSGSS